MFTPYVAFQAQNKQRRSQIESGKQSVFKNENKIFTSLGSTSPCRSTKSHENPLKWSTYSGKQAQKPQYLTTRSKIFDDKEEDQRDSKKNLQIMIRQSLRRSLTTRRQYNGSVRGERGDAGWTGKQNSRKLSQGSSEKSREDILDFLSELQGKKCVINANSKPKFTKLSSNIPKSKSLDQKAKPKPKQLKIQFEVQIDQQLQTKDRQPIVALGMAAKRENLTSLERFQQHCNNNANKIAISTTQCLIFGEPNVNKSFAPGLYIESQTNFIRAKKKSKALTKKVANLQKQQDQQVQKLGESRIFEFKNNITKNVNLKIGNSHNKNQINNGKQPRQAKKQENIRIQGWEINPGWEMEPQF